MIDIKQQIADAEGLLAELKSKRDASANLLHDRPQRKLEESIIYLKSSLEALHKIEELNGTPTVDILVDDGKARLRFAWHCLQLARKEIKDNGRQFMQPGETVIDSALQYAGAASPKITRQEMTHVAKMNKERRKALNRK